MRLFQIPAFQIQIGKQQQHTPVNIFTCPRYSDIHLQVHNHNNHINNIDGNGYQHDFIDRLVFPVPETALNSTSPGAERRYPNNMMYIVGNAACTNS